MGTTFFQRLAMMCSALLAVFPSGCGVEAGNPDSKDDGLFRIFVAPSSYSNVSSISVVLRELVLRQGERSFVRPYSSDAVSLLGSSGAGAGQESALVFELQDIGQANARIDRFELNLPTDAPFLLLKLDTRPDLVKAVVLNESGEQTTSLLFEGQTVVKEEKYTDLLVDFELRKSLQPLGESRRLALKLPQDVVYAIQQKHSFQSLEEVGSMSFSGFAPGTLVCVFADGPLPTAAGDTCTGPGFKSQIVAPTGQASIASLRPGTYKVVTITTGGKVAQLKDATIVAGEKVTVTEGTP